MKNLYTNFSRIHIFANTAVFHFRADMTSCTEKGESPMMQIQVNKEDKEGCNQRTVTLSRQCESCMRWTPFGQHSAHPGFDSLPSFV